MPVEVPNMDGDEEPRLMDMETAIEKTTKRDAFGRYQLLAYGFFCFSALFDAVNIYDFVFILGLPKYRCVIPDFPNDTFEVQSEAHQVLINNSIPDGESCTVYERTLNGSRQKKTCSKWVYDDTLLSPSALSEFDIVCDKLVLRSVTTMVFMFFKIVGGVAGGQISDRFGRKKVIYASLLLKLILRLASGFAPDIYWFMTLRGLSSMFCASAYQSGFVWIMEFVKSSKRQTAGIVVNFFFAIAACLVTAFAYFIRSWRYLTFALTAPFAVFIGYWWLIIESPRWLISRGRRKEAEQVLRKVAMFNGNSDALPAGNLFDRINKNDEKRPKTSINFCVSLKSRTMVTRLICLSVNWAATSAAYYGLSLNSGNLSGDLYVNFLITGAIEIPAYTFALFAPMKFGRKYPHAFSMIVGGVACIVSVFPVLYGGPSLSWMIITLSTVGKLGTSSATASVGIWTPEMTPTCMRVVTLGIVSTSARISAMITPYITDLGLLIPGPFSDALPLVIFGAFAVFAGLLSLILPETLGRPMPVTIEDALKLGKKINKDKKEAKPTELVGLSGTETHHPNSELPS